MNSYVRDDGVVMVETKPGCFTRRDSLGALNLTPLPRRAAAVTAPAAVEPPPIAPTHEDLAPEPAVPPPLQPSHVDLEARAPAPTYAAATAAILTDIAASIGITDEQLAADWPPPVPAPPRAARPRPAKRSIATILAEADRNHRTRKSRA